MNEQDISPQLDEIAPLVDSMFRMSEGFVTKFGSFLPHGAKLNGTGQVAIVAAAPENDVTNSEEVLPLLHEGLRQFSADWSTQAVAVSEHVFIGEAMEPAIKVLVEHRDGLTLAFYKTWKKRLLRKPLWGDIQMQEALPEVGGWKQPFTMT